MLTFGVGMGIVPLVLGAILDALAAGAPEADPHRAEAEQRQAALIARLIERGDSAAVGFVLDVVDRGLPPRSLDAFLEGARRHPMTAWAAPLRELTVYRKAHVRARALVAWAAIGPDEAREATLAAMNDPELQVRLLGVDMAGEHTTPELEAAVLRLLERDPDVAAVVRGRLESQR